MGWWRSGAKTTNAGAARPSHLAPGAARQVLASRTGLAMWSLSATILFGTIALFVIEVQNRYNSSIEEAERTAQSFADVLAEHTARTLEAIDRALGAANSIRKEYDQGKFNKETAHQALRALWKSAPALGAIGWTDQAGNVIAVSTEGEPVRRNIADLEHFRVHSEGLADGIYISPLFRSRANGQWISAVSRPIEDANGHFAGVVSAPLDLTYFARIYQSVKIGPRDSVALISTDGMILTREPFLESAMAQSYKQTPLFTQRLKQSAAGVFASRSPVDGIDRIFGYRQVPGLPLVMLVTASREDALARWYDHLRIFGPLLAVQIAVVLLGTHLLWRRTQQLSSQSLLLETTLETMQQGLVVVDETDRIAICNRRAIELLELPPELMASRPSSKEVIAYQTSQGEFDNTPASIMTRVHPKLFGDTRHVYERQRSNGTLIEVQTVPFANGGTVRTYTDITHARVVAERLRESEQQFRLLAENATDIIARLNFEGRLLYISPATHSILGYSPEELMGSTVTDFIHPDDVERAVAMFAGIRKGNQTIKNVQYRFLHKEVRWIWLEASPTLVVDDAGRPTEFVDVVRDITVRKAYEHEAALAREQTQQALAVQSQFLATMSHELRTPLNGIVGFSEMVLDRVDLPTEVRRQVGLIQTASDTLLAVVNDVLDFAKIEEGKLELAPVHFAIAGLVEDSMAIIRTSAAARKLQLGVDVDARIPPVLIGDDHRLRQILLNLLNNAVKFTPRGRVDLCVERLQGDVEAGEHIRFAVTDTGIGIPQDKLDRLFLRFSQVDSSTSREFGGSGLGLAISKRLIEAMGGEIGVSSRPGEGSTFWFSLRLPVGREQTEPQLALPQGISQLSATRVLLVEDIDVNREIACVTLERLGFQVDAVVDGADAILMMEANEYDVVLMDIQMPGMDGLTATRHIRLLPEPMASVPIIAMTANVLPTQVEAFLAAGMNGHIGKPFKRDELIEAIVRCTHRSAVGDMTPGQPTDSSTDVEAIEALTAVIGQDKIDILCGKLAQRLQEFVELLSANPADGIVLRQQAHNLVSSAGMLGFKPVSQICAELESELAGGQPAASALSERVRRICVAALKDISQRLKRGDFNEPAMPRSKA